MKNINWDKLMKYKGPSLWVSLSILIITFVILGVLGIVHSIYENVGFWLGIFGILFLISLIQTFFLVVFWEFAYEQTSESKLERKFRKELKQEWKLLDKSTRPKWKTFFQEKSFPTSRT